MNSTVQGLWNVKKLQHWLHPSNIILQISWPLNNCAERMVRPFTGNPTGWTRGTGSLDTIACWLIPSAWPLATFVCIHITESSWPVCAYSGKDIDCWSGCTVPSPATKPGFGLRQASFVFLRWRWFRRYLAPSSVNTSRDRAPKHISTFAFTASLLEFPGGTSRTVSPLLSAPKSLAPLLYAGTCCSFLARSFW